MLPSKPALFVAVLEMLRNARRARQDRRLLRAMSERELHDLGVGRSEIPALMLDRVPFSDASAPWNRRRTHAPYAADAPPARQR